MKTTTLWFLLTILSSISTSAYSTPTWILDSNDITTDFFVFPFGAVDEERLVVTNAAAPNGGGFPEFISYLKFYLSNLPTSEVSSAFLSLDKYCAEHLCSDSTNTVDISVQNMSIDVASTTDETVLKNALGSAVDTVTVGADGIYNWDITSLVNSWITGAQTNNGFALTGRFDTVSFDGDGAAILYSDYFVASDSGSNPAHSTFGPQISPSPVPIPAGIWLMISALAGLVSVQRKPC